ncbi:MAG: multiheme c-type cytochrome [Planctomycetota bacterium]|jgi:formate-dependent nitrite reductase cytochrome c552 subunit
MRNKALYLVLPGLLLPLLFVAQARGEKEKDAPPPKPTYVGAKSCRMCHAKQHRGWRKMKHAQAWENLPAAFRAADKKDEKGRACISCHVTGYGKPGGFESADKSTHLLGVQCESCHGPGSLHKAAAKKLPKGNKKFPEGADKLIQLKPTNCADCHNPHVSYAKKYKPKPGG